MDEGPHTHHHTTERLAPEGVQKIAKDQRVSQMLLVCYNLLNSQNSNNWPMVSFNHNGSERTTWMGIASKPKAKNPEQHF